MDLSSAVFRNILSPFSAFERIETTEKKLLGGALESGQATRISDPNSSQFWPSTSPEDSGPSGTPTPASLSVTPKTLGKYKWTIQGADPDARRFFAVPQFALHRPPLRIDVYLPPLEDYSPEVRSILKPEEVIYSPRDRIPLLVISRWLAAVLEQWCTAYDTGHGNDGKFQAEYESMPFGSRILVTVGGLSPCSESLGTSPGKVTIDHKIYLVHDYGVEQEMLTTDMLREMWGGPGVEESASAGTRGELAHVWPIVVDLEDLCLKRQFHEAISIVTIPRIDSGSGRNGSGDASLKVEAHNVSHHQQPQMDQSQAPKEYVFKSLTRDQRYLYNELKMLLSLEPHDNVIPKPRYIVTKRGRFGGRRGVCGFVLEYFPTGSLKQFLLEPYSHSSLGSSSAPLALPPEISSSPKGTGQIGVVTTSSGRLPLDQKAGWAKQITRALIHINNNSDEMCNDATKWCGFYPDLKPDNIVLRPVVPLPEPNSAALSTETAGVHRNEAPSPMYYAVLLDLEQRGGWFSWSPPEIKYLEYLEILLNTSPDDLGDEEFDIDKLEDLQDGLIPLIDEFYSFAFTPQSEGSPSETQTGDIREKLNPASRKGRGYFNSEGGFSAPWLALLAKRKRKLAEHNEGRLDLEKAQVFMLGKLLWCIFEEEALMRCGIDHEMLSDVSTTDTAADRLGKVGTSRKKAFPEFEHAPMDVRGLIKACTAGAEEWDMDDDADKGWRVVLNAAGKLVPSVALDPSGLGSNVTAVETQRHAAEYWGAEVDKARAFVSEAVAYERQRGVAGSSRSARTEQAVEIQVQHSDDGDEDREAGARLPGVLAKARSRPTLEQVLQELEQIFG